MDTAKIPKTPELSSEIEAGTDRVIDATFKVKPDTEGLKTVRLAVVNGKLEAFANYAHLSQQMCGVEGHDGAFADCQHPACSQTRHLIENTRQMIEGR